MKLLVGLGNPGVRYEKTRHNIGFMVIDSLADSLGISLTKKQNQALIGQGFINSTKVILAKPQTYMNLSGEAVLEILHFYKDSIDDFIVIHDDLDLPFGKLRFRSGGSSGGHNGLKSITKMLNSQDFARLKMGIDRPDGFLKVESYVLSDFLKDEVEELPGLIKLATEGLKVWCLEGMDKAMNQFNPLNIMDKNE